MVNYLNIAITNRCNLNCCHCDIWQESPKKDISLSLIKNIVSSSLLSEKCNITLTGGEPFLHRKIFDIVDNILRFDTAALKTISTNGTLKEPVLAFLERYASTLSRNFKFNVSFDGINTHAIQRNSDPALTLKTLFAIKGFFPNIRICLKFTITVLNYKDILPSYRFALKNGFDFKIKLVEDVRNYTNKAMPYKIDFSPTIKISIQRDLAVIFKDLVKERKKNDAGFVLNTIRYLRGERHSILCRTPFEGIFVMPDGLVYSCLYRGAIGDLKNESFDDVNTSLSALRIRKEVKESGCNKCVAFHGYRI